MLLSSRRNMVALSHRMQLRRKEVTAAKLVKFLVLRCGGHKETAGSEDGAGGAAAAAQRGAAGRPRGAACRSRERRVVQVTGINVAILHSLPADVRTQSLLHSLRRFHNGFGDHRLC